MGRNGSLTRSSPASAASSPIRSPCKPGPGRPSHCGVAAGCRRPGPVRRSGRSSPAPGRPRRGAVTGTATDSDDGSLEVWLRPRLGPLYSHGPDWARCHRYASNSVQNSNDGSTRPLEREVADACFSTICSCKFRKLFIYDCFIIGINSSLYKLLEQFPLHHP